MLTERHHRMVYNTCLRALGGAVGLAEDATQAVFVILARKAKTIRNTRGLARWLFRTAGFVAGHMRREESRRKRREERAAALDEVTRELQSEVSWWTGVEEVVYDAISRLGAPYQEAVVLHYLEGMPQKDVAAQLGCSEAAVSKRITRALAKMRGTLVRRGVGVTAAALASYLAQETVQAASTGLAATCTATALAPAVEAATVAAGPVGIANAATRAMMLMRAKIAAAAACSALAVTTGTAVVVRTIAPTASVVEHRSGMDYSLPGSVLMTPYAGVVVNDTVWRTARNGQPHLQDGLVHTAAELVSSWRELNPAEDVYRWAGLDRRIAGVTASPGSGFVLDIRTYRVAEHFHRGTRDSNEPAIPLWVIEKDGARLLSDGTVAAWAPGCRVQDYLARFLRALGERYGTNSKLIGVVVNGFCVPNDSIRLGVTREVLQEAEQRTGLTPDVFRLWSARFARDWASAFRGQEHKLLWSTGGGAPMPGKGYETISSEMWRSAYRLGFGGYIAFSADWLARRGEAQGMRVTDAGYTEVNESLSPIRAGRLWFGPNDSAYPGGGPHGGSLQSEWLYWFLMNTGALQARCNWISMSGKRLAERVAVDPAYMRWLELSLGKTARTSADAWCLLHEAYVYSRGGGTRALKNFERWLMQRDVLPDGRTVPAERVNITSWAHSRDYEFHARRTDVAGGSPNMYFKADPAFVMARADTLHLKVTYLDKVETTWLVEYRDARGKARTESVATTGQGGWRTVTFEMGDTRFDGAFADGMDFRIRVTGDADLTVKFVRLVKPDVARPNA